MSGSSGKEIAGEEEGEGEEPRTLVVRARDGDWIMGDDLVLVVTGEETVVEIQEVIKSTKDVPLTRMAMFKGEDNSRISDKHMTWSLSRNGLYAGDILVVEPTRPNQWLWHPLEWYEERVLESVEALLAVSSSAWGQQDKGCALLAMEKSVPVPPPLRRDSLKAIFRRFPERVRLELDVVSQKFEVFPNKKERLLPLSF